jgi:hypothetical protein
VGAVVPTRSPACGRARSCRCFGLLLASGRWRSSTPAQKLASKARQEIGHSRKVGPNNFLRDVANPQPTRRTIAIWLNHEPYNRG